MISATWWTNSAIYIPEYSQYRFQHAALNLITKSCEFTLLQYSTTLSSLIASFCIIFDICNMMNQQYYIYSRILPVLISSCCIEFNHYKTWIHTITVFYNTLKLNHIILYHIWYLQHDKLPFYIYSRILPVLISTCCIEFNHYKTWIHSITVFYNTLKLNHIILYHIWYLQNDKLSFYIYSRILPVLISSCCIEFNHYKTWIHSITVFYNTLKLNHIILYHIWYLQHDKLSFYIYSRILPVLISTCCIEFNHYKTWIYSITVFYNTLMHNHIILYHILYLQHDEPTVLYIFQNTPSIDISMP